MKNFYKKPSHFTTLPNSFAQDDRISIEARGLGLLIFSLPEDWTFRQSYFYEKAGGDGLNRRKTVVKALNELIKFNYLFRDQERGDRGKFGEAIWMFDPEGGAKEALQSVLSTVGTTSTHGATSTVGTLSACPQGTTTKEVFKKEVFKKEISSSTPPPSPIDDEEGVVSGDLVPPDPYADIPEEGIGGLDRETIVVGIEHLVTANAADKNTYRSTLIREILSGGGRTLANIRRQSAPRLGHRRIGSNRVLALPVEIDVFDLYEALSDGLPGGAA